MIYFSSDWHLGHRSVLHLGEGRPFRYIEEHDQTILDNTIDVAKDSVLYIIGDVSHKATFSYLKARLDYLINNKVDWRLVPGNHDEKHLSNLRKVYGERILDKIVIVEDEGKPFVLCHYPMLTWPRRRYGAIHLHGHLHGALPADYERRYLDVSTNVWDFKPISSQSVISLCSSEDIKPKTKMKRFFIKHFGGRKSVLRY